MEKLRAQPKRILVTGHTGLVGRALMKALSSEKDLEAIGVSRSSGTDLCAAHALDRLPEVDRIVHLAGFTGVPESWEDPRKAFRDNFLSALEVFEFARQKRTPVVLLSSYMYGAPQFLPITESHPIDCFNPYAASKRQVETLAESYSKLYGVPVLVLRPFNIYGPSRSTRDVISHVLSQVASKADRIRVQTVKPRRDYLHVDDLAQGIVKAVQGQQAGYHVYNLGSGKSHSVQDVLEAVFKQLGRRIDVADAGETRPNEVLDCYSDSSRFEREFGWKPQISLEDGISTLLGELR